MQNVVSSKNRIQNKSLFLIILAGFFIRSLYLWINYKFGPPPVWYSLAHVNLAAANYFMGISSHTYDLVESISFFKSEARGVGLLLIGFIGIFGKASLWQPALVQIPLDCLAIVFCYFIAREISSEKLALAAAFVYAFFPYNIWACVHPAWYVWTNFALFVVMCLYLRTIKSKSYKDVGVFVFVSVLALSVAGQFRANLNLLPYFLSLFSFLFLRCYVLSRIVTMALASLVTGLIVSLVTIAIQYKVGGDLTITRTHMGHSFLMGVGQHDHIFSKQNKLDSSDESVIEFFHRESGNILRDQWNNSFVWTNKTYIDWTKKTSKDFINNYPFDYLKMVLTRIVKMMIPTTRISFFADTDAVAKYEDSVKKAQRLDIIQSAHVYSVSGQWVLLTEHSLYFFEFWCRIFSGLFLFFGAVFALLFSPLKQKILFLFVPLLYTIFSTALIRYPNFDHMSVGWVFEIPCVVVGWGLFLIWIRSFTKTPPAQSRK